LLATPAAGQESLSGAGKAADGDTLTLGADRIRLFGIDAPEFNQACERSGQKWSCGEEAKARLAGLIDNGQITCLTTGADDFGRLLARCTVNGVDINNVMVAWGYAVAFRRYSMDYVPAEEAAKAARRGVWAGSFQMPSEFRQAQRGSVGTRSSAASRPKGQASQPRRPAASNSRAAQVRISCDIKGNRNRRGQWIYHLPGMPYYSETRAEEMFCSEAQAQAAGYRRAIVK
jgi:endonuclease YncB( thermonuclease family)